MEFFEQSNEDLNSLEFAYYKIKTANSFWFMKFILKNFKTYDMSKCVILANMSQY